MTFLSGHLVAFTLLAGLAGAVSPGSARAAQSYDNCTGTISSLPATITTQGVWCLKSNLSTNITGGAAISIDANNVTIDCNDFKIGGLAAGDASNAFGIFANNKQNATVRHCNVRGFYEGIRLDGGAGHLVEDNRLDNNLFRGIYVHGDNNRVRRNAVYDTGGRSGFSVSYGIYAFGHVIDNTVAGVFGANASSPWGIVLGGAGSVARDNRVSGLQVSGNGAARGIFVMTASTTVDDNQVTAPAGTSGNGIEGFGPTATACSNNVIAGFSTAIDNCLDNGGNASL